MISEFRSLDDAVHASFPVESCRLVALREHGDGAVALFDTRPSAEPYLYQVNYRRHNGRWSEGISSNGSGWSALYSDSDLGVETVWGEAPASADRVRGELDGQIIEEAIANGIYLLVWWDVPSSDAHVTAFRVKGQWVQAPTTAEQL